MNTSKDEDGERVRIFARCFLTLLAVISAVPCASSPLCNLSTTVQYPVGY